jgi:hypothetical protein
MTRTLSALLVEQPMLRTRKRIGWASLLNADLPMRAVPRFSDIFFRDGGMCFCTVRTVVSETVTDQNGKPLTTLFGSRQDKSHFGFLGTQNPDQRPEDPDKKVHGANE